MTDSEQRPAMKGADLLWALALGVTFAIAYVVSFQTRMFSDGSGLVTFYAREITTKYHHALYLPTLQLLGTLVPLKGAYAIPELLSSLSGGVLVGATFGAARGIGATRGAAALGAALAGASPVGWFFATTVEVPAFHGAVVAVAALVCLSVEWSRFWRALFTTAAFFMLVFPSHQTGLLLGPGWVALVALAARRQGHPIGATRSLFVVGPVLLAALAASMLLANVLRGEGLELGGSSELELVRQFQDSSQRGKFLWNGWLAPLALLVPMALLGAWRSPSVRLAGALLCGMPFAFFLWWAVPERGAYMLGSLPFWAALAALAPRGLLVVALVVQVVLARFWIGAWDQGFDPRERVELVRAAAGESGNLYSINAGAPLIDVFLPGFVETNAKDLIVEAYMAGWSPEQWAAVAADGFRYQAERGAVAFDFSFEKTEVNRTADRVAPYLEAVVDALSDDYILRRHGHPFWEIGVLERRSEEDSEEE